MSRIPGTADSDERSIAVQHDPHRDAARPPRSRGGGVVATSTVPAVRFVRVRHAGTERRFVLLDVPTRERYVELVARSARRDRGAPVAFGDGQPGRVMERASARARAAAVAARAAAVRRPAGGSRGPAPDDRVRRRPPMLRVDVAVDRRRRARSGGDPDGVRDRGVPRGPRADRRRGSSRRPGRVGGPGQRRPRAGGPIAAGVRDRAPAMGGRRRPVRRGRRRPPCRCSGPPSRRSGSGPTRPRRGSCRTPEASDRPPPCPAVGDASKRGCSRPPLGAKLARR